jgi:putative lipoic acid-binding regulatory protein
MSSRPQPPDFEFPCSFPLKAIGRGGEDFEELVVEIVRRHVPDLDDEAVSTRSSERGKYLSVTVTFIAQSQAQLEALYQELSDHDRVLVVL